ncbi:hypothetical protein Q5W88_16375 [Shouchella clausii]|uniref:hypothetical protein n=1 Tax=Shouchella clausii TaxID=79880 RepID=UPI0026F44D03|nr:hypothetical protein [Shouchella clausii]MDO7284698.1 hypothetical protein [Shouchella clausii]MDO7304793.1 hypothetical protein [Shouchella clausii]
MKGAVALIKRVIIILKGIVIFLRVLLVLLLLILFGLILGMAWVDILKDYFSIDRYKEVMEDWNLYRMVLDRVFTQE